MTLRMPALLFLLLLSCLLPGCGGQPHARKSGILMDTVATLQADGPEAEAAVAEGMRRLEELDQMMGDGEGSDAALLADAAGKGYVPLHPEVYHVLEVSQQYSQMTDGAWDVTAGAAIALWGIGTDHARVPGAEELEAARHLTGWQHLRLRAEDCSAMLELQGMRIHLGGLAKGYALDEVRRIFRRHGIENGLVDLGNSSLCALGKNGKGRAWRIGIRHPRQEGMLAAVPLSNAALSTSGDYERFLERDGRRYCHILDPRTAAPAAAGLAGVTVVVDGSEEDCGLRSDILSTAIFVMGAEEGRAFAESLPSSVSGLLAGTDGRAVPFHGLATEEP